MKTAWEEAPQLKSPWCCVIESWCQANLDVEGNILKLGLFNKSSGFSWSKKFLKYLVDLYGAEEDTDEHSQTLSRLRFS